MGTNIEQDERNLFTGLNKSDVYKLIEILQVKLEDQLNEPIRVSNKRYAKYHQGFSKFPLQLDTLQNVYYKSICQDHDVNLTNHANQMTLSLLKELDEKIKMSGVERQNIPQGNQEAIKNIVSMLINTPFKRHIDVFFKLQGIGISNELAETINQEAKLQFHTKTMEKRLRKEEQMKYDAKLKKSEDQYKQIICEKDRKIQDQDERIKALETSVSEKIVLLDQITWEKEKTVKRMNDFSSSLTEYQLQQSEQAAVINGLKKEINTSKMIRYLTDKHDMETLANRMVAELDRKQLRDKFLDFMEKENIFSGIIRCDTMLYSEFCRHANEKWESEQQALLIKKHHLEEEVDVLQKEKEKLVTAITEYTQQREAQVNNLAAIEAKMQHFVETLDDEIYNHLFNQAIIRPFLQGKAANASSETEQVQLFIKEKKLPKILVEEFDFKEIADNIADNLASVGVSKDIAYEVACLFIGCVCAGLTPLIYGYRTRKIAEAIAAAVTGGISRIITLPPGFCDMTSIVKQFQTADSGIVLFEDAVGSMNETSLLPLLRGKIENSSSAFDKLLVLTTENYESVQYLPLNLWSYFVLITVNDFESHRESKFIYRKSQEALRRMKKRTAFQPSGKIAALTANLGLFKLYNLQREEIINYISMIINEDTGITAIAGLELLTIAKANGVLEILNRNVKNSICSEFFKQLIEKEWNHDQCSC